MQRFKNILLVKDPRPEEKSGLWRAADLAQRNGGRITLLDVIPDMPVDPATTIAGVNLSTAIISERRRQLEEWIAPLRDEGVNVSVQIRIGRPFLEIIRAVMEGGHDLVVKPARGALGLSGRLFGTTALHLMRKCPCPVWIVKPGAVPPHRRILAAVDPAGGSESLRLDTKVLEVARRLAHREEAELHVIHAWSLDDAILSGRLPRTYVEGLAEQTRSSHADALHELLDRDRSPAPRPTVHLERGAAATSIINKANEIDADLIVMGTVSRTGISGLFIGSTAEEVLQQARCSVLTAKPDGFRSPVEPVTDRANLTNPWTPEVTA